MAARPEPLPVTGSRIKRTDGHVLDDVSFAKLIEMIATGDLGADDEVALLGEPSSPSARSTSWRATCCRRPPPPPAASSAGRARLPGAVRDTSMLEVLAHMRQKGETGALFVERSKTMGASVRKELYLSAGRLLHVASSDREGAARRIPGAARPALARATRRRARLPAKSSAAASATP